MVTALLIVSRALHLGSGMIVVAVVAFRWLVFLPAIQDVSEQTWNGFTPLFNSLHRLLLWSGITLVVSGLTLFWSVSAAMSGSSLPESLSTETLSTVLFQTQFGAITLWRAGLIVLLAVLLWRLSRTRWLVNRRRSRLELVAGIVAVALVVLFSGTGHAAAATGLSFWLNISADVVHLWAATVWPGGLLPFAIFLAHVNGVSVESCLDSVLGIVNRFSTTSLIAVIFLTITGTLNACVLVGSFAALFQTSYGQVLCLKLLLFSGILGIAAWNRFALLPSLSAEKELMILSVVLHKLQSFVIAELTLTLGIVGVVSFLGTLPPSR